MWGASLNPRRDGPNCTDMSSQAHCPAPAPAESRTEGTTGAARLRQRWGNQAAVDALRARGQADGADAPLPHRDALESAFGEDLGDVRARVGQSWLRGRLGASAVAGRRGLAFADADPDLETVAHEVAHWLQPGGGGSGLASAGHPAEAEADGAAADVAAGRAAPTPTTPTAGLHRDPSPHPERVQAAITTAQAAHDRATLEAIHRELTAGATAQAAYVDVHLPSGVATVRYGDVEPLSRECDAAMRSLAPAPVAPDSPRSPIGVAGVCDTVAHPVVVEDQPHPDLPTPQARARLDHLVAVVRADLATWATWQTSFEGPIPGDRSYAAADEVQAQVGMADYGDGIRGYLRAQLGADGLHALQTLVSFRQGAYISRLADEFGVLPRELHHSYRLTMQGGGVQGSAATGRQWSIGASRMVVEYRNDSGMSWRRGGTAPQGSVGVGINLTLDGENHGPSGGTGVSGDLGETTSPWTPAPRFWRPSDFGTFVTAAASASASLHPGAGPGPLQRTTPNEGGALAFVRFLSGPDPLQFDMSGENQTVGVGTRVNGPTASAGAGLSMGGGRMTDVLGDQEVHPATQVVCDEPVEATSMERVLARTTVWFATDADSPVDGAWGCLDEALRPGREFLDEYPDGRLFVRLVAHASPRVRAAGADEAARQAYDRDLSERRAASVSDRVLADMADHGGSARCEVTRTQHAAPELAADCGPPLHTQATAEGSRQADQAGIARDQDPPQARRVDVTVLRTAMVRRVDEERHCHTEPAP